MKIHLFFLLCVAVGINAASDEVSWKKIIEDFSGTDASLKLGMKEQMLSDLVYAACNPERQGETRMFIEIINRRMNGHNSPKLSKAFIVAMIEKFVEQKADALQDAKSARDAMTVTDPELNKTKNVLKNISYIRDLNGEFEKMVACQLPECKDIPCGASPEELAQKVEEGVLTEEQIVTCMHCVTLAKLLAFCLLKNHFDVY